MYVRTCGWCGQTKDWKAFIQRKDNMKPRCHDCWREHLSIEYDTTPHPARGCPPQFNKTKEERLADFIARLPKRTIQKGQ